MHERAGLIPWIYFDDAMQMSSDFVNTCEEYFYTNKIDPFKILQVEDSPDLTRERLTAAYKAQALLHHPDRRTGNQARFSLLSTCYKYLWERLQVQAPTIPDVAGRAQWEQAPAKQKAASMTMEAIKNAAPLQLNTVMQVEGYTKIGSGKELQKWEDLKAADEPDMFSPQRTEYVTITQLGDQTIFRSNMLTEDWNPYARRGPIASRDKTKKYEGKITTADINGYSRPTLQPRMTGPQSSVTSEEWRYLARMKEEREREQQFMSQWSA